MPSGVAMADYAPQSTEGQSRFIAAYLVCGTISGAGKAAGVNNNAYYSWMQHDPTFAPRMADAKKLSAAALEDEARRRAMDGDRVYKFFKATPLQFPEGPNKGEPYYEIRRSDAILLRLLEANDPEKWGSSTKIQHSGDPNQPLRVQIIDDDNFYGNADKVKAAEDPGASEERARKLAAFQATHLRQTLDEVGIKSDSVTAGTRAAINGNGAAHT